MMSTEEKNRYFKELTLNLQYGGFTVRQEGNGLLPIEFEGKYLCFATENGGVRYWKEDVYNESRSAALDKVTSITKATAKYMSQLETAPFLLLSSWQRFTAASTKLSAAAIPLQMSAGSVWSLRSSKFRTLFRIWMSEQRFPTPRSWNSQT